MTTPPSFPTLAGQGWSVHKKPMFATIVASHVSGREVRDALYENPIWEFELTFDGLDSASSYTGLGANSLQALMGFSSPAADSSRPSSMPTRPTMASRRGPSPAGDGATTTFTFGRFLGSFFEPVGWVTSVANVYLNGVNQPSGWSLTTPNSLVFVTPPGNAVPITATFAYSFQCRFDADDLDFEEFMQNLWSAKSVKFRSVRAF